MAVMCHYYCKSVDFRSSVNARRCQFYTLEFDSLNLEAIKIIPSTSTLIFAFSCYSYEPFESSLVPYRFHITTQQSSILGSLYIEVTKLIQRSCMLKKKCETEQGSLVVAVKKEAKCCFQISLLNPILKLVYLCVLACKIMHKFSISLPRLHSKLSPILSAS